ncbi:(2Fe-2S)-binding protein [Paenibacillus monticola]|uniref:Siderophore-iron reductase, Fe-S cluster protein n=1 Tax=Paenibacillus monticola TaxID=2666075 RepID=A0A7X2H4F0_9BACL|nr:(2Fe-2S)-binding protein [Paenibacillus monticola]MRN53190.1 siderophore-iron reductase, Fe-S cluster protein [Paenibacillus monticola]
MHTYTRIEEDELAVLSQYFGLTAQAAPFLGRSVPIIQFLDKDLCAVQLAELTDSFQFPSQVIAASQFSKRYAFIVANSGLYAMTMYNKGLDYCLEESCFEWSADKTGVFNARISKMRGFQPVSGKREQWRDDVIRRLFAGQITPVLHALSKAVRAPLPMLWENVAVRVFSLYEKRLLGAENKGNSYIQEDYNYLIHHAPGALFGEKVNPLAKFYKPPVLSESSTSSVRIRQTCCQYYKISSTNKYCSNCPLLQ